MKGKETNKKGGEGKVGEGREEKGRKGIGSPTFSKLPPCMLHIMYHKSTQRYID
jgi:hypothetical protein